MGIQQHLWRRRHEEDKLLFFVRWRLRSLSTPLITKMLANKQS
jgi:hypothetical protein